LKLQEDLYKHTHRQEKEEILINQKSTLFNLEPQINILEKKITNSIIRSPASGSVLGLTINAPGQIIPAQAKILEIVPNDQSFVFEAKVQPKDIDLIQIGQEVEVKFSSFNIRFEYSMFGVVDSIGADVKLDETTRTHYYQVIVKPTETMLEDINRNQWTLMSGMPVGLFIKTRQQTLAEYLLRPFKEAFMRAFNEDDGLS
jgi:multidrug efflux pump subunit AcrA (membrane-fusion protein)